MTNQELFTKAEKEMKECYESGIRCISTSDSSKSVMFFRDFTQGQIDGIYTLTMSIYLDLIYNTSAENEDAERAAYIRFCTQIREKANELRENLIKYTHRYM